MKVPFVFSVLFLATVYAQAQDECSLTCTERSKPNPNDDGNWVVIFNNGVSYFYLYEYNSLVIVNIKLQIVVVINGNNGTLSVVNTNSGFSGIINIISNVLYFNTENNQTFDLANLADHDYSEIILIVQYTMTFTDKVVGENIDTSQSGYEDADAVLRDYANTVDYTQWVTYEGHEIEKSRVTIATIMHGLFVSQNYTVEWGTSMYIVVVTGMANYTDEFSLQFNSFIVSIVQTLKGEFSFELMQIFYQIISSQDTQSSAVITEQFRNITWALNGVGSTYENLWDALQAFKLQIVVQTYVSTIITTTSGTTNSYLAYNSMRNGTWIFRITYSNQHYVQITSSFYDEYMGIIDPSIEYVLVFTKTNNFALLNYKTGNGLIINGFTGKAVYVTTNDQNIVNAFAENRNIDGFKLCRTLAENTKIPEDDSFDIVEFLKLVKDGDSPYMLNEEQLASFNSDFSYLTENLAQVDFDNEYGFANIVGMMLSGPKSEFFQLGFIKMVYKMFGFQLCSGRFYRIVYAGILNSIDTDWAEPVFENMVVVMGYLKPGNSQGQYLTFLEQFCWLSWGTDVTNPRYLVDGTYKN